MYKDVFISNPNTTQEYHASNFKCHCKKLALFTIFYMTTYTYTHKVHVNPTIHMFKH